MVHIALPVDEKIDAELQELDDKFQEIKAQMSEIRKKGKDTSIAETLALDFLPKLRMAKVTYEREDVIKIQQLLKDIQAELKEAQEGSLFKQITEKLEDAYESLRQGKPDEANSLYTDIISHYKELPKDMQRLVYSACAELRKRLESSGK